MVSRRLGRKGRRRKRRGRKRRGRRRRRVRRGVFGGGGGGHCCGCVPGGRTKWQKTAGGGQTDQRSWRCEFARLLGEGRWRGPRQHGEGERKGAGERSRGPERLLRSDGESIFPGRVSISQVQSSISVPGPFILRAPGTLKHLGVENRCRERSPIPRLYYCYYFTNYYYYYGLIPSSMWLWFVFWLARPEYACYLQGFA